MKRTRRATERPLAGVIVLRVGLALISALFGYWALATALASAYATRDVGTALSLAPWDGRLLAEAARQSLSADPASPDAQREAADKARRALTLDPTVTSAVGALGLLAQLQGNSAVARRDFAYAERLSRRDLSTQLWLIEDAVERGEVSTALHHYDVALRSQNGAGDILFPVLVKASNRPAITDALVRTLRGRPSWSAAFLSYLGDNSEDQVGTARFFAKLGAAHVAVPAAAQSTIIGKLVAAGRFDAAWDYYATLRGSIDRRRSRDPRFAASIKHPAPFDWLVTTDPAFSVVILGGGTQGSLVFAAPPSVGGELARQLQLLPPGQYRLEGHSAQIDEAPQERPFWSLRCAGDGRDLLRLVMPNSSEGGGRFIANFTVPADCSAQLLTLNARGSSRAAGLNGEIDYLLIAPQ